MPVKKSRFGPYFLAAYAVLGAASFVSIISCQEQLVQVDGLDLDMGSVRLGAMPSQLPGTLVKDGEGACDRLPYSVRGYCA